LHEGAYLLVVSFVVSDEASDDDNDSSEDEDIIGVWFNFSDAECSTDGQDDEADDEEYS